jgi:AraC-like DNA-binding protein
MAIQLSPHVQCRSGRLPWSGHLSIHTGWAHYFGPIGDSTSHTHYAVQVVFPPTVESNDPDSRSVPVKRKPLVIPSGARHQLRRSQQMSHVLFIEPPLYDVIHPHLGSAVPASSLESWLGFLTQPPPPSSALDRLNPILQRAADHLPPGYSARDAAVILQLSRSHFSGVFRDTMGLPFRQWVLWTRLSHAIRFIRDGADHTQAAYNAGFSDSAHLARTTKRMFGIALSAMRPGS